MMLRRLLAIYMAFALVAGPSLCCCTTLYASPHAATGPATPSSERTPPCCCKDHYPAKAEDAAEEPQGVGGKSQPAPKPGKHQCPCKDKGGKQTFDSNPTSSATAQDALRLLTSAFQYVVAFTADFSADPAIDSGGGPSPPGQRLTSWRLLNAPHMLRC